MNYFLQRITALVPLLLCITVTSVVIAQENVEPDENASNPLSKGRNTDLRVQYYDLGDDANRRSYNVEGATMLAPQLKLKYEACYWNTKVTPF